jgi:hypothetical protein
MVVYDVAFFLGISWKKDNARSVRPASTRAASAAFQATCSSQALPRTARGPGRLRPPLQPRWSSRPSETDAEDVELEENYSKHRYKFMSL